MDFNELDLLRAQKEGIISPQIFDALVRYLAESKNNKSDISNCKSDTEKVRSKLTIENFLYYFGAFIIISTMGWYLGNVWNHYGHAGLLAVLIFYFVVFALLGNFLWSKEKQTPGGLLYVCAVSVVPLAVWAFENLVGIMPKELNKYNDFHILIRSGWIFMEIATIFAGAMFLKYRKFPLLTLPICYSLWYLSMDIVPLILGQATAPTWGMRNFATTVFAVIMLAFAFNLENKKNKTEDYSHWLYIFGATMLWGAVISIMTQFKWDNEFAYFLTAIFNFAYMIIGILIRRRVFIVWGAIGFWTYLGHLAFKIFANTPIFPIVLIILGLLIIFSGIYYSKNCKTIEEKIRKFIGISNF